MYTIPAPTRVQPRLKSLHFAILVLILALTAHSSSAGAQTPPEAPSRPSDAEIIQRMDLAVYQRLKAVTGYTVREQYNLYRDGNTTPAAQETIQTTYRHATGKDYKPVAQSGSSILRSAVIDHILAGEKEVNLPANREAALITSRNYELSPQPGFVQQNGRDCIVVELHPRRKSTHLFTGRAFVDASDFTVVRLEGAPSQSPSFFAGATTVSRDYAKIGGFAMATHAEARSHSRLFGDTLITIDYTGYQIDRDPATPDPK